MLNKIFQILIPITCIVVIVGVFISKPVNRMTDVGLITSVTMVDAEYMIQFEGRGWIHATKEVASFIEVGDKCSLAWSAPYSFGKKTVNQVFCEDTTYNFLGKE